MQTTLKTKISSQILGIAHAPRSTRLACRCQLVTPRKASAKQQQPSPSPSAAMEQASLALAASMLPTATVLPSFADDVVAPATDAVTATAASAAPGIFGMSPLDIGIAFSPLLIYGLFSLYREKINPRAKITDLFFIIAAFVVFGNIFSILIFKKRIY